MVSDGLGSTLPSAHLDSFKNKGTGAELAGAFHLDRFGELAAVDVPYGEYALMVSAEGFPEAERPIKVADLDVRLTVTMRSATVHLVRDADLAGDWSKSRVVSFTDLAGDLELAPHFDGMTATRIPYGVYELQVFDRLGRARRRVDVFQPEVWVIFGPETYGELDVLGPRKVITGTIQNIRQEDTPIFVRLMGTYFNYSLDDKVTITGSSGTFTLAGNEPYGKYLLMVIGKNGVLDLTEFDINQSAPLLIELHEKK